MALSPKEREKIIEEEKLRYETRQALHAEACAKHPRRGRWLWWAALLLLAYAAWSWVACGPGGFCRPWGHGRACMHGMAPGMMGGYGMGMHGKKPCPYMQDMDQDEAGVKPGQPVPDKK